MKDRVHRELLVETSDESVAEVDREGQPFCPASPIPSRESRAWLGSRKDVRRRIFRMWPLSCGVG